MAREKGKKIWKLFFKSYLESKEKIFFVVHKHPILHIKNFAIIIFFGLFIPFALWFLFPQTLLFVSIWGAIGFARLIFEFVVWYYEVWLITNISIIDIDWDGLFEKSSTRVEYHHVETISYEIKGFLATIFNYGDLIIEKTTGNNVKFHGVFRPKKVARELTEHQESLTQLRIFQDHRTLQNLLSEMIQTHVKKHGTPKREEPR